MVSRTEISILAGSDGVITLLHPFTLPHLAHLMLSNIAPSPQYSVQSTPPAGQVLLHRLCRSLISLSEWPACPTSQLPTTDVTNTLITLGTLSNKKNDIIWEFFPTWGGGLPKSQNFCKFTKYFFVCQIGPQMAPNGQKHVILIIWDHFGPS